MAKGKSRIKIQDLPKHRNMELDEEDLKKVKGGDMSSLVDTSSPKILSPGALTGYVKVR